jgi:uncharacterized membrane protein YbhN (UPF0104 family)
MKTKTSTKKMKIIATIITLLSILFVSLGFIGVYLASEITVESLYLDLTKVLLVLNLILLVIYRELWKQEKNKVKYSKEYTFMVSRK